MQQNSNSDDQKYAENFKYYSFHKMNIYTEVVSVVAAVNVGKLN